MKKQPQKKLDKTVVNHLLSTPPYFTNTITVMLDPNLTLHEKVLFMFIYHFSCGNSNNGCAATNFALSRMLNVSLPKLKHHLKELEKYKLIKRTGSTKQRIIHVNHSYFYKNRQRYYDGWRTLFPDKNDHEIITLLYRFSPEDSNNQLGSYTSPVCDPTLSNININLCPKGHKYNIGTFIQSASTAKENYEIDLLVRKFKRQIINHRSESKRLVNGIKQLRKRYDQINRRIYSSGKEIKRYTKRKPSPAYLQIKKAITVYSNYLKQPHTIIYNRKGSPYKVGLDEFFMFSKATRYAIDTSKSNNMKRFEGLPSWFDLCHYGPEYIDAIFGLIRKDRHPKETEYLIMLWEEHTNTNPKEYSALEKNAFISFTDRFLAWYDQNRLNIYFPDSGYYDYDSAPEQGMRTFFRFLHSRRKAIKITQLYADWLFENYVQYCIDMLWLRE